MYGTAIAVFAGLTFANFLWEFIYNRKNWALASEKSFFQALAIGVYIFAVST